MTGADDAPYRQVKDMVMQQVLKCEACGAALHPEEDADFTVCAYCGTRTAIRKKTSDAEAKARAEEEIRQKVALEMQLREEEERKREAKRRAEREEEDRRREEKRRADRQRELQQQYAERVHRKWVAFTLCLLFGYFGIHKFYERKIVMGIVYFFTGGLLGIGWFVDCILLLFRRVEA